MILFKHKLFLYAKKNLRDFERTFFLLVCFFLCALPVFAKLQFTQESINSLDEILCIVKDERAGFEKTTSPLYAKIKNGNPYNVFMLSPSPESLELLQKNEVVLVRNRFGNFRFSLREKKVLQMETFSPNAKEIFPLAISPDGKWFCSFEKNNFLEGKLFLENVLTKEFFVLDKNARLSYKNIPVKWSSDSSFLVYEKNGAIYFANPQALSRGVEIDERYRKIAKASIRSVTFHSNTLFFIQDGIVFSVNANEFYARALYTSVIGSGIPCGRLPENFDDESDCFSISDDGKNICIIKNKKYVSQYCLQKNTSEKLFPDFLLPYINQNEALLDATVFYDANKNAFALLYVFPFDKKNEEVVLVKIENNFTELLRFETNAKPMLSPSKKSLLFFGKGGAFIFDLTKNEIANQVAGETIFHALWKNENEILLLGNETLQFWNVNENTSSSLFPTNVKSCFWKNDIAMIETASGIFFSFDINTKQFSLASNAESVREVQNGRYRIFLGSAKNISFENTLYIRMLLGKPKTVSLFSEAIHKNARAKNVHFLFDAIDNPECASLLLSKLKTRNLSATFFLNGNFITRYPNETKQIANANVVCASLFFTSLDFASGEFVIDEEFVRRGLARNEDEFFALTGKELALLWHAPFYHATDAIREFGKNAGYEYVDAKTAPNLIECYNDFRENKNELCFVSLNSITENKSLTKISEDFDVLVNAILELGN